MNANNEDKQRYTGLILLSGIDAPGVASALFSALEPFSITIVDVEQLVIRSRLILTVLIDLDPAHAQAIDDDLNQLAAKLDVDIAMSYGTHSVESIQEKSGNIMITVSAEKLSPGVIADLAKCVFESAGNIERIQRLSSEPRTVLQFQISGNTKIELEQDLKACSDKFGVDINFLEKN
jgi:phosphoserine phosphatase